MFVAQDRRGHYISSLSEGPLPPDIYYPSCGVRLLIKSGCVMSLHFSHPSNSACPYHTKQESDEHLSSKDYLFHWGSKHHAMTVEDAGLVTDQVADIALEGKVVLEIQCSPLSQTRLKDRTLAYESAGLPVLWLLGHTLWLKDRLTPLQRSFINFSQSCGFYLWELDVRRRCLRLRYLLHEDISGCIQGLVRIFPFDEGDLLEVLRYPYNPQYLRLKGHLESDPISFIARRLYYRDRKWLRLQEACYLKGENLLAKSPADFYPQLTPVRCADWRQTPAILAYHEKFTNYYHTKQIDSLFVYPPSYYHLPSNHQKEYNRAIRQKGENDGR